LAVLVNEDDTALDLSPVIFESTICIRSFALRIAQQGERESELGDIALVTLDARRVHSIRPHIFLLVLLDLIVYGGELLVSARGVVPRVEHEQYVRFPQYLFQ
jgi:hypothetical protein